MVFFVQNTGVGSSSCTEHSHAASNFCSI